MFDFHIVNPINIHVGFYGKRAVDEMQKLFGDLHD